MLIPMGFTFHEASDPQPEPQKEEKVTLEQRLQELQSKDNELYSAVYGKGVTKGKKEVTEAHLQEATDERYKKTHQALAEERIHRVLVEKARERGFQHPEDAADLLRTALTLNENLDTVYADSGEKVSVDDAIDKLAKTKPHWVQSKQTAGTGSSRPVPNHGNGKTEKPVFKRSQLRDSAFYLAHEQEILEAARDHRILDE
jgi:hypothetical protein